MSETDNETFVRARLLGNFFEGQQAEALLGEEQIPCMIRSFTDTALDGLYQTQKGWGEVRVPESLKDKAIELLSARLPETSQVGEAELESQAMAQHEPVEDQAQSAGRGLWWFLAIVLAAVGFLVVKRAFFGG